ncbi:MAG: tetratricopeptide repeat protein [Cyclobacteriaceae bacterium]|nr:tetratricopeptide repeat protein [Cyclobacteriaceae bacterium]
MKNLSLFILLLIGFQAVQAQGYYLPVSTASDAARQYYYDALISAQHADIRAYNESIQKAVKEDPEFFMAYAHRALGMVGLGQYDVFEEMAGKVLAIPESQLNPAEKSIRKALEILKSDAKGDLFPVLSELVSAYPDVPQVYDLGMFVNYWIDNDYQAALENGKKLVKLDPKCSGCYNMLGYAHMKVGDMKSANTAFKKYIELAPKEANAYDSMGEYYMNVKDYKKSVQYYEKAAELGMEPSRQRAEEAKRLMSESN